MSRLWYEQPAAEWEEALPIGNGRLGAMALGESRAQASGRPEQCSGVCGGKHFLKREDAKEPGSLAFIMKKLFSKQ